MVGLCEIHYDPKHFPEPKKFDPPRFLNAEGKFVPHPTMVAFGVSKRECLGKTLAKQETFLFSACLLHQFEFREGSEGMPSMEEGPFAVTRSPKPFKFRAIPRQ